MKTLHIFIISSIVFLLLLNPLSVNSQNGDLPCIIYEKGEKHLEIRYSTDSNSASFGIVRIGYETQEQRDRAYEIYRKGPPVHTRIPLFYIGYTGHKVGKESCLSEIECSTLINYQEARENEELFAYRMIFIEKRNEDEYILWRVRMFEQLH